MSYKYKFSVVMPIYNTEQYLNEAIDSILDQTIGFKEKIQLILINDGSTDNSEEICIEYKDRYPDNIIYIKKTNGGVSDACNAGLTYIEGAYVNFFSSDDRWSLEAYEVAENFFDEHKDEIDVVSCKIDYFDRLEDKKHPLDSKYTGDMIIDLNDEYKKINSTIGNTFIKSSEMQNRKFNTKLIVFEDGVLLNDILLDKCKYGIISSASYYYRKRDDHSSLTSSGSLDKRYYFDVVENFYNYLINLSKKKYGNVKLFIQYIIAYQMQFQLKNKNALSVLDDLEKCEFKKQIKKVLKDIDISVIYQQKNINLGSRFYILNLKCGENVVANSIFENNKLFYNGELIYNFEAKKRIKIKESSIIGKELILKGTSDLFFVDKDILFYVKDNKGNLFYPQISSDDMNDIYIATEGKIFDGFSFTFTLPMRNDLQYEFYVTYNDYLIKLGMTWVNQTMFGGENINQFFINKSFYIKLKNNSIMVQRLGIKKMIKKIIHR